MKKTRIQKSSKINFFTFYTSVTRVSMQPAHKTMHCDNSCEISRNNFPENDPETRGISRLNVTFFNVDKANFSVFANNLHFLSRIARFNAISRHFLFHHSTRTKFLSYVFHLVSIRDIAPGTMEVQKNVF